MTKCTVCKTYFSLSLRAKKGGHLAGPSSESVPDTIGFTEIASETVLYTLYNAFLYILYTLFKYNKVYVCWCLWIKFIELAVL